MTILIALAFTGTFVGIISTFFGLGGGAIIIPVLYAFFSDLPVEVIISSSLGTIFINNFFNFFKFRKLNLSPDLSLIIPMGISVVIGVYIGIFITQFLNVLIIKRIFSIILCISSCNMLFLKTNSTIQNDWVPSFKQNDYIFSTIIAFFGGIIATTTGLGGSVVIIPILILLLKIPFNHVPSYTNIVVLLSSGFGAGLYMIRPTQEIDIFPKVLQFFQVGFVNWGISITIASTAFFSSWLGIKWAQKTKPKWAKKIFAALLIIVALKIFISTL